ncbi:hypothetical protein NYR55_07955 [Sphingomonas sp. BGYR3]|uniref:hypothetical protein n=1 Tax=Sphingomonas sp. BGYR3 TaxID=2975483 RepID=UPI0021A7541E|nr:hypothetical protein [Sphingomonas sp. BGYR3]MDG5488546.1 hypothetical protein [Sphingomonas sp. BGYR3]
MIFDALALLVTKATFIGLRLFVLYLVAASLGSAEFGPIAFALTTAEIVRFAADWGIDTLSLRFFASPDHAAASVKFRSVVRIKIASGLIALAVSGAIILAFTGVASLLTALLIAMTAVTSLWLNLAINWLQARGILRPAAVRMSILGVFAGGAQIAAHLAGWGYEASFGVMVGFEVAMAALMLKLAFGDLSTRSGEKDPDTTAMWLRASTPIALANILALSYARFDQIYIRVLFSSAILGQLALAARLTEPLLFVAASMTSTIYARASTIVWQDDGIAPLKRMIRKWITAALVVSTGTAIVLAVAGNYGLRAFFPTYSYTPTFLWIALAALPFRSVNLCLTVFIQALGEFRRMLAINLANFAIIAVLVVLGGYAYGFIGAAIAVLIGEMLNSFIQARTLVTLLRKRTV